MTEKQKQPVRRIAVIRVKGATGLKPDVRQTLKLLRLYKKHTCVVISNTEAYTGMLTKVKETVTWGELDEETCKALFQKRGRLPGKKILTDEYIKEKLKTDMDTFVKDFMGGKIEIKDVPGMKQFFKLTPPKKGFERKGIKTQFSLGGALGYRKDRINSLVQRML